MKYISLLGATGSIGTQALDVIRNHPQQFSLVALSVGKNIELTRKIIAEFRPEFVSVQEKSDYDLLKTEFGSGTKFSYGRDGLVEAATYHRADILLNAVIGSVGLYPTLQAIAAKKRLPLLIKRL